jgi:hypothetical protein
MPTWFAIALPVLVLGCVAFLVHQVRQIRLQKRNLKHWEKGEPLEGGVDKWD